jgi:hypothetical protein
MASKLQVVFRRSVQVVAPDSRLIVFVLRTGTLSEIRPEKLFRRWRRSAPVSCFEKAKILCLCGEKHRL